MGKTGDAGVQDQHAQTLTQSNTTKNQQSVPAQ